MANNEVMMGTVNTAVEEVAKKADNTGVIFVVVGFAAGAALTVGVTLGASKIKKARAEKKAKKAATAVVVAEK